MIDKYSLYGVASHERLVRQIITVFKKDILPNDNLHASFEGYWCGRASAIIYLFLEKRGWSNDWKFRIRLPDNGLDWIENVKRGEYHTTLIHKNDLVVDASNDVNGLVIGKSYFISEMSSLERKYPREEILEPEVVMGNFE